jgi:hypothetical protein
MMYVIAEQTWNTADAVSFFVGMSVILAGFALAAFVQLRKAQIAAGQDEDLRQLVRRYEQLAQTVLDTQQRVVADVSDLRSRAASVEQILRSVE